MTSPQERTFKALHLEKHLTGKQLARLLYPQEFVNEVKNPAYQRVMKSLKRLEASGLLKSKSYGLAKDKLWFLAKHKVVLELGYTPPKGEIHAYKYDHEKDCADVFVSLALSDSLLEWEGEGDQKMGLRYDRKFRVDDRQFYLEVERGTQGPEKLRVKLERYIKHYREKQEPFNVLFTVIDEPALERIVYLFEEFKLPASYSVVIHSELVNDPLNARISTRFDVQTLVQSPSN
jgi:hypothetical protein